MRNANVLVNEKNIPNLLFILFAVNRHNTNGVPECVTCFCYPHRFSCWMCLIILGIIIAFVYTLLHAIFMLYACFYTSSDMSFTLICMFHEKQLVINLPSREIQTNADVENRFDILTYVIVSFQNVFTTDVIVILNGIFPLWQVRHCTV